MWTIKRNLLLWAIGRIGPKSDKPEAEPEPTPVSVPKCVAFSISMKNSDKELCERLMNLMEQVKSNDTIDVKIDKRITHKKEKLNVKPEYGAIVKAMEDKNTALEDRFYDLLEEFAKLDCRIDVISGPKYDIIPDNYYEWNEYDDYKVSCRIGCQEGTKFYGFLQENGLLEKYFPEWYRKGEY